MVACGSFGVFMYLTVRLGAVFRNQKILRCDSVRFTDIANLTVRFGAVPRFLLRCGANPRRKNRRKPYFPYGAPYE